MTWYPIGRKKGNDRPKTSWIDGISAMMNWYLRKRIGGTEDTEAEDKWANLNVRRKL